VKIIKYDEIFKVDEAVAENEPLIAVILFDGSQAIVSHIDEAVEHHILLQKAERNGADIDKYFRIVFDKDGADWTFVCPQDYKNISDKTRRIAQFYKDGFEAISEFLSDFGYSGSRINIPERYKRIKVSE
jgi:predicted butyrate kinase (DUF1464 family)